MSSGDKSVAVEEPAPAPSPAAMAFKKPGDGSTSNHSKRVLQRNESSLNPGSFKIGSSWQDGDQDGACPGQGTHAGCSSDLQQKTGLGLALVYEADATGMPGTEDFEGDGKEEVQAAEEDVALGHEVLDDGMKILHSVITEPNMRLKHATESVEAVQESLENDLVSQSGIGVEGAKSEPTTDHAVEKSESSDDDHHDIAQVLSFCQDLVEDMRMEAATMPVAQVLSEATAKPTEAPKKNTAENVRGDKAYVGSLMFDLTEQETIKFEGMLAIVKEQLESHFLQSNQDREEFASIQEKHEDARLESMVTWAAKRRVTVGGYESGARVDVSEGGDHHTTESLSARKVSLVSQKGELAVEAKLDADESSGTVIGTAEPETSEVVKDKTMEGDETELAVVLTFSEAMLASVKAQVAAEEEPTSQIEAQSEAAPSLPFMEESASDDVLKQEASTSTGLLELNKVLCERLQAEMALNIPAHAQSPGALDQLRRAPILYDVDVPQTLQPHSLGSITPCNSLQELIKGEIDNDELSQPSEAIDHSGMEEIEDDLGSTGCNFSADDTPPDHPDQLPEFSSKDFTPEQAEQFDALDDQMVELEARFPIEDAGQVPQVAEGDLMPVPSLFQVAAAEVVAAPAFQTITPTASDEFVVENSVPGAAGPSYDSQLTESDCEVSRANAPHLNAVEGKGAVLSAPVQSLKQELGAYCDKTQVIHEPSVPRYTSEEEDMDNVIMEAAVKRLLESQAEDAMCNAVADILGSKASCSVSEVGAPVLVSHCLTAADLRASMTVDTSEVTQRRPLFVRRIVKTACAAVAIVALGHVARTGRSACNSCTARKAHSTRANLASEHDLLDAAAIAASNFDELPEEEVPATEVA